MALSKHWSPPFRYRDRKDQGTLSSYKAMDIIASRSTISPAVEKIVKEAIDEEFFVNVSAVVITNIDFSDAFELAVEEKMIAEQAKLITESILKSKFYDNWDGVLPKVMSDDNILAGKSLDDAGE